MSKKEVVKSDIVKLSEVGVQQFITSGISEIDEITGGIPVGKITQIYGLASIGKTTLMIKCLASISPTHKVLFCDTENALNVDRVVSLGGDLSKIDYSNVAVLEEVAELIRNSIGKYDLIVLDSIAMLTPRTEHEGEFGQANVGLKPRLLGQWLRMITKDLADSKTALVLINQMRMNMDMYGEKYVLPGGLQLKFSSSLMLKLATASKDRLITDGIRKGHWVNVEVTKSKVSTPFLTTKFKLLY